MFADSHTHIHDADFPLARNEVLGSASEAGVNIIVTMTGSIKEVPLAIDYVKACLLYTSPSPRDKRQSRMPSSA